jgi:hypothetical protein
MLGIPNELNLNKSDRNSIASDGIVLLSVRTRYGQQIFTPRL